MKRNRCGSCKVIIKPPNNGEIEFPQAELKVDIGDIPFRASERWGVFGDPGQEIGKGAMLTELCFGNSIERLI